MRFRSVLALLPLVAALVSWPASAQDSGGAAATAGGVSINRDLRTVEEQVNTLKERVFRSKATLQLLKELVVEGSSTGARVILWHLNDLGSAYRMEAVQYFLDGRNVYSKADPGGQLAAIKEMRVHEQSLAPGAHNLQVRMVLRGNGYGVFSYLRTYQFDVSSSYSFKVDDGKASIVRVISDSRGGLRNFVDRPNVRYEERSDTIRKE